MVVTIVTNGDNSIYSNVASSNQRQLRDIMDTLDTVVTVEGIYTDTFYS